MYEFEDNGHLTEGQFMKKYASQKVVCEIIDSYQKYLDGLPTHKKQNYPKHIDQLTRSDPLISILTNPQSVKRSKYLKPFISPNQLIEQFHTKNPHKGFKVKVLFYYEPTLNNDNLKYFVDAKALFYKVKKQQNQKRILGLTQVLKEVVQIYQGKVTRKILNFKQFHSHFVIPLDYCPLILLQIKNPFKKDNNEKYSYLIVRYEQYLKLGPQSPEKIALDQQRKEKLKEIIEEKKHTYYYKPKVKEIGRKQQLKTVYNLKNFSIGCIRPQIMSEMKSQFHHYFDVNVLQRNINNSPKQNYNRIKAQSFVLFNKTQYKIPVIKIVSFLYENIALQCLIQLSQIQKVSVFSKKPTKQLYLHLGCFPQYQLHLLNHNSGQSVSRIQPWERVENFAIEYQKVISESLFIRNMLSSNCVICIDLKGKMKDFEKIIKYFQSQEIFHTEFIQQRPKNIPFDKKSTNLLDLEDQFHQILGYQKDATRILVHEIKFSLLSLKSMDKMKITFDDMIDLLRQIQASLPNAWEKYSLALKSLCLKPHQLLSKPFPEVYSKFFKRQEFIQTLAKKFPELEQPQLEKIQQAIQWDGSFSFMSFMSDTQMTSQLDLTIKQLLDEMGKQNIERFRHILLPRINFTANGVVYAGWSIEVASKVLKHFSKYQFQFLKAAICDKQDKKYVNSPHITKSYIRSLMSKLGVLDEQYLPLGWSQSQLREGCLWYTMNNNHIQTIDRKTILQFLGNFNHISNPALKAARIGQNFGSSWSFDAKQIEFTIKDDICVEGKKDYVFSDGIGCISAHNMQQFKQSLKLDNLAAIQIRYKGVKGMISLNKQLPSNTVIIRKSMVKFQSHDPDGVRYFDIIEYSKYKVGYLNRQIIMLLMANKIMPSNIMQLQAEYINQLESKVFEVLFDNISYENEDSTVFEREWDKPFESISQVIKMTLSKTYKDKKAETNKLILDQSFFRALKIEANRRLLSKLKQKFKIRVQKSVRLFGILDEFQVLNEYEVYCSIVKTPQSQKQNITGKCILTKNPCLHPADIRVVTCVSDEQIRQRLKQKGIDEELFEDLVNVIIFPQQGKIPLTMEISRSDLDGDEFFLSWDKRIIPSKRLDPFVILDQVPFIQRKWTGSGYEEMLDFFVQCQNNNKMGVLANAHLVQADINSSIDKFGYSEGSGAFCQQCIQLCKIHSVAVQYPKKGYDFQLDMKLFPGMYPNYMQKQFPYRSYYSKSILNELYKRILWQSDMNYKLVIDNKNLILRGKKQNYQVMIKNYVDFQHLGKLRQNYARPFEINPIMKEYEPKIEKNQFDDYNDNEDVEEGLPFSDIKNEKFIEDDKLYHKNCAAFSSFDILQLKRLIEENPLAQEHDRQKPFSLVQIMTTLNYMCIYVNEIKKLTQLLESQHQSIYTIHFQLNTSSKKKNNLNLLEKIKNFRFRWLKFFGSELANEGVFKDTDEFEQWYFRELIEKTPEYQNTLKTLQKLKGRVKNVFNKKTYEKLDYDGPQEDVQFIQEQIYNLQMTKKSTSYDTYRYSSLKQVPPLVYRKLVLYYMVSTSFTYLIQDYKPLELLALFPSEVANKHIYSDGQQFCLHEMLKFGGLLRQAELYFEQHMIDFLGFGWFCLPKLMVVWWRTVIASQEKRVEKERERQQMLQKDDHYIATVLQPMRKEQQQKLNQADELMGKLHMKRQEGKIRKQEKKYDIEKKLKQIQAIKSQMQSNPSQAGDNKDCIIY